VLVSDDQAGRIWRVSYGQSPPADQPGDLDVTTETTGSSQPTGYTVTVDGSQSQAIETSSSVTFPGVAPGDHSVALTDVPANCTVSDPNLQTVTVSSGQTVTATFSVSCADVQ